MFRILTTKYEKIDKESYALEQWKSKTGAWILCFSTMDGGFMKLYIRRAKIKINENKNETVKV